MPLMPAFRRRKKNAAVVGRLIAGYNDLELLLALCIGMVMASKKRPHPTKDIFAVRHVCEKRGLKALYRIQGAERRLKQARKWTKKEFEKAGLKKEYEETLAALGRCRKFRNLFAHSLYGQSKKRGLFFVFMEEYAKRPQSLSYEFRHASSKVLDQIEDYF